MQDPPAWQVRFDAWVKPFVVVFNHKTREEMAKAYLVGLMGPGDRKSIEPIAARVLPPGQHQRLHNFVSVSTWDVKPLETIHIQHVNELVGGPGAYLIIDDTGLVKQGRHSVGVAHQYCGQLGKNANCQCIVTLTLARDDIPVPIAMRLYLPKSWCDDAERRAEAKVPEDYVFKEKWRIALDEVDNLLEQGVKFYCLLADAGYGSCADFRHGLTERGLTWAVGILSTQGVYPSSVKLEECIPSSSGGRPRKYPRPDQPHRSAKETIDALDGAAFQTISWRDGTKGPLTADFAAIRVRAADGKQVSKGGRLPGDEIWLVCERRRNGEVKYYFANHSADTPLMTIVRAIKARWSCEQAHQQMKEELGLDHFECRSWRALSHHLILTMIAFAFLQTWRIEELCAQTCADSTETSSIEAASLAPAESSDAPVTTVSSSPVETPSSIAPALAALSSTTRNSTTPPPRTDGKPSKKVR
jgi:SRSO17 transposase